MMELTYCPDGVIGVLKQRRYIHATKEKGEIMVMAFNDKVRIEQCMEQNNETLSSYDMGQLSSSNPFNWVD